MPITAITIKNFKGIREPVRVELKPITSSLEKVQQFIDRVNRNKVITGGGTGEVAGAVTGEVSQEIIRIATICAAPKSRKELMAELGLKHEDHFRKAYLLPALETGRIEQTIPDKPTSRLQRYRLTGKGRDLLYPVTAFTKAELPAEKEIPGVVTEGDTGEVAGVLTGVVTGVVIGEVSQEIVRIATICATPKSRKELMAELGLKHEDHFRRAYLLPALETGRIEQTIPDKPTSRFQKYRLTDKGRKLLQPSQKGGRK